MNNSEDSAIITLDDFVPDLSSISRPNLSRSEIVSKIIDKTFVRVNPAFRCLVLLSKILPLARVSNLFNDILDRFASDARNPNASPLRSPRDHGDVPAV
jgi:hypothetical protein